MRVISETPRFSCLLDKYKEDLQKILSVYDTTVPLNKKYEHWDKIRYKVPPKGLNCEQWWLAIKLTRLAARQKLVFRDKNNQPFGFTLTNFIADHLLKLERQLHQISGQESPLLGDAEKNRYLVSSLVEESITSSQLEGASTSRSDARIMIRSGRGPRNIDEQMILNNYFAMGFIQKVQSEKLTIPLLLQLHKILSKGTMRNADEVGRFQHPNELRVHVGDETGKVVHRPPAAAQIPERVEKIIRFANQDDDQENYPVHPVIRAIILHFMVGYDHPFTDGNGRVARAIFYWFLLHSGYEAFAFVSISQILKKAPAKYSYAYQFVVTDECDLTYFIHHQLEVIDSAMTSFHDYVLKKQSELHMIESTLKKMSLNYRQLALLSHAVRNIGHVYTIRSHRMSHRCAYATARSDLFHLEKINLLEMIRLDGKTLSFISPQNIKSRIESYSR